MVVFATQRLFPAAGTTTEGEPHLVLKLDSKTVVFILELLLK